MTTFANPPTLATSDASSKAHYQLGQNFWDLGYGLGRTSVTPPPVIPEDVIEPAASLPASNTDEKDIERAFPEDLLPEMLQSSFGGSTQTKRNFKQWFEAISRLTSVTADLEKFRIHSIGKDVLSTILDELHLQQIEDSYIFRDEAKVRSALKSAPFLTRPLINTYNNIITYFPGSQVFIEAITDYENYDYNLEAQDNIDIAISIATSMPAQEALERLNMLYDNWWTNISHQTRNKVSIGLEFV